MRELASYFKGKMKNKDEPQKIFAERNFVDDIEYNIEHEVEHRKRRISHMLKKKYNTPENLQNEKNLSKNLSAEDFVKERKFLLMEMEMKMLETYNLQKRLRREIVLNYVNDFDRHNTVFHPDTLFHKNMLNRSYYKRPMAASLVPKRETRLSEKFEQQLRIGIDFRKRDKHLEFLHGLMLHQNKFVEYHKQKKVRFFGYFFIIFFAF